MRLNFDPDLCKQFKIVNVNMIPYETTKQKFQVFFKKEKLAKSTFAQIVH